MVIVNNHIDIISVLFIYRVVLFSVIHFPYHRRFVIEREIERITVASVVRRAAVAVIERTDHFEFVLTVVDKSDLGGIEFEIVVIRKRTAALRERLQRVVIDMIPEFLARNLIRKREFHLLRAAEKPRQNDGNAVYRAESVGYRDFFFGCRDFAVLGRIDIVKIRSERNHIIVEIFSVRRGRVIIGFNLIVVAYRRIVSRGFDFVISFIEHRRFRPVAVKRKEWSVEAYSL